MPTRRNSGARWQVGEEITAKPGMYTVNTGMFEMSDHPVPAANLLGAEGDGFRIAMGTLISGRLSVAAGCLGVIEDCLAEAIAYSKTRIQHGKPIGRHQLVQEHIAEIEIARAARVLQIPREAVFFRGDGPGVYIRGWRGFKAVPVRLGRTGRANVEVLSGLREGDAVALTEPEART